MLINGSRNGDQVWPFYAQGGSFDFAMEHVECVQNLHSTNIISIRCWPGAPKFLSGSGLYPSKLYVYFSTALS